jgi:cell division protein FtsW
MNLVKRKINSTKKSLFFKVSRLVWSPLLLIVIGLFFISLASPTEANTMGMSTFFLQRQLIWAGVAIISFFIFSKISLSFIFRHAIWFYLLSLISLTLVLFPQLSHQALGASRWLRFGPIGIQPAEFFKLSAILVFSQIFSQSKYQSLKYLLYFLVPPIFLILLQPNFSSVVLISAITVSIFYLSGVNPSQIALLGLAGFVSGYLLVVTTPYRLARLDQTNYHSQQLVISLSAGGWFGKGLTNSDQKFQFLPKTSTDSILAVITEETGIIGIIIIFYLYLTLIGHLFKLAKKVPAPFSLFVAGLACWLAFQSLINAAAISAILPITGVPLPLISYGGSSLLSLMVALGLARNIELNYAKT